MTIKVGDKLPDATLMHMSKDGPAPVKTSDYFKGKTAVLFSVPGAFTPTCSMKHLPGFIEKAAEFKAKGVDELICIAVNDVFVMDAWGKSQSAQDRVTMLADGNGEFSRALGLGLDATKFGMGQRGQRFSLIVKDGVVKDVNVEAPGEFKVSTAEHALGQL
ncbi:peroxiredoxin [Govanella unica]|uniref:Glutathione-dependent peroxiredoxin n=1 Tax=Govanella unica TaxID=2975056 RepID=A0A9X3TXA2_9PROT|nr:peroxiredoxin [Govania unica]MDA5193358.1 peroxiredoxin [Govania unica]